MGKLASSSGFRTVVGCPSGFIKFSFFSVLHISSTKFTMSMFSGLANQITGFVASKTGGGAEQPPVDPNDPNAQMDPNYVQNGAEGEVPPEGQAPGGMLGNITSMIPGQKREEEVPDPNMAQQMDPNAQGYVQDPNAMVDPATGQYYDQTAYQQ